MLTWDQNSTEAITLNIKILDEMKISTANAIGKGQKNETVCINVKLIEDKH